MPKLKNKANWGRERAAALFAICRKGKDLTDEQWKYVASCVGIITTQKTRIVLTNVWGTTHFSIPIGGVEELRVPIAHYGVEIIGPGDRFELGAGTDERGRFVVFWPEIRPTLGEEIS